MAAPTIDPSLTGDRAYSMLMQVKSPSIEDFKLLGLLEASGQRFYDDLMESAPNEAVRKLLARNGQEEMAHAHRIKRVIKMLYDEDFAIPAMDENPFCKTMSEKPVVSKELLNGLIEAENTGEAFYEGWASTITDEKAAKLLRQNGKEESKHSVRAAEAIALL